MATTLDSDGMRALVDVHSTSEQTRDWAKALDEAFRSLLGSERRELDE